MEEQIKINNYIFQKPLTNDNSGFSRWGFGMRSGKEYFVKEFLSPTYPVDKESMSEIQFERKKEECEKFENEKFELYSAINNAGDGTIVRIDEFFRMDTKYYIATAKVYGKQLTVEEINRLNYERRLLLCMLVAHAIMRLHDQKIIHGDLKPENILITTLPNFRVNLIDFDCSFFEDRAPELGEELNGDFIYLSPEAFLHIAEIESNLTCKMDVFAAGILLHQYLTGEMPGYNTDQFDYFYEAALNDDPIQISHLVACPQIRDVLQRMYAKEPENRPDMHEVFDIFQAEYSKITGRYPIKEEEIREEKSKEKPLMANPNGTDFTMAGDL